MVLIPGLWRSLGGEMATRSSTLVWKVPCTEEPVRLQSMGSQGVRHDWGYQSVSSVAQSCPTLCDLMDCSITGFPVHDQLLELTQTHVHRCYPTISSSVVPFSSHLQSFPASESFPRSQFFTLDGQSIGVSASASALQMNIQNWFPLGWTGWISL